jgi:hypothetical protein
LLANQPPLIALTCRDTKPQDKAEFYRRNTKPKYKMMRYQAEIYCRNTKPKFIAAIENNN